MSTRARRGASRAESGRGGAAGHALQHAVCVCPSLALYPTLTLPSLTSAAILYDFTPKRAGRWLASLCRWGTSARPLSAADRRTLRVTGMLTADLPSVRS